MPVRPAPRRNASAFTASVVMVVLSFVFLFVPLLNGLIAGLVGGYMAGSVRRALVAAIIPAFVVGVGLAVILYAFQVPALAAVAGAVGGFTVLFSNLALFLGAAVGGALSHGKARRQLTA
jgi:hypothetical protein